MTPAEFKDWRKRLRLSQAEAATALGLSKSAIEQYEAGRRKGTGKAVEIPRTVALACQAIALGLSG